MVLQHMQRAEVQPSGQRNLVIDITITNGIWILEHVAVGVMTDNPSSLGTIQLITVGNTTNLAGPYQLSTGNTSVQNQPHIHVMEGDVIRGRLNNLAVGEKGKLDIYLYREGRR